VTVCTDPIGCDPAGRTNQASPSCRTGRRRPFCTTLSITSGACRSICISFGSSTTLYVIAFQPAMEESAGFTSTYRS